MEQKKPAYLSKTLLLNLAVALCALFVPGGKEFIESHAELVAVIFSGLNIVLRLVTKSAIELY